MGFLSIFNSLLLKANVARDYHHAPSEKFPTQAELMGQLILKLSGQAWASFHYCENDADIMIQVTGDCINTCMEEVDVPAIARQIGLTALADSITSKQNDRTVHILPHASPAEIAEVVHGIFLHHYGLPPSYRVEGWQEG